MKLHDLQQGSSAWHEWRKNGIGGSDIGPIFFADKWPYPDTRREKILKQKTTDVLPEPANFAMNRGSLLEPIVRIAVQSKLMTRFVPQCVSHDDLPWALASLDGYSDVKDEIIEIKCPNWQTHNLALAGMVPWWYMPQVQWQLFVSGSLKCHYVSFTQHKMFADKDKLVTIPVVRDFVILADIIDKARNFWDEVQEVYGHKIPGNTGDSLFA